MEVTARGFRPEAGQGASGRPERCRRATGSIRVYLPAPHEVARAFYTAFTTPPRLPNEPWLHQSLGHSIRTIFWGFLISSIFGVPLGILCGTYRFFSRLQEPFIEFFRYLPAPAFGALCVAILGIDDAPEDRDHFHRHLLPAGARDRQHRAQGRSGAASRPRKPSAPAAGSSCAAVVIPASITDIYTDMRILLGWAWTYLIVAEVVGTMSGITYFINQQARYRNFDNVYAAIVMIGIIGSHVRPVPRLARHACSSRGSAASRTADKLTVAASIAGHSETAPWQPSPRSRRERETRSPELHVAP